MLKRLKPWIFILILTLVSIFAYSNIFNNEFVWDDHIFVEENTQIRSWTNVPDYFVQLVDGLYRPLRTLLYTVVFHISELNPFGYHLNALILHILSTILVFGIIFRLTNKKTIAFISSLAFALHPMHTERVANITAGFDLLGIVFLLLAFYLYLGHIQQKRTNHPWSVYIVYFLGILANEEALILPLLIFAYHLAFPDNSSKQNWKKYIPYSLILIIYFLFRIFGFSGIKRPVEEFIGGSFLVTFLTTLKIFVFYPILLIIPYPMIMDRRPTLEYSLFSFPIIISIIILLFYIYLLFYFYKKDKTIFFGMLWFWISLLIFTNVFPTHTLMAERYLYLPSVGFCLILGYLFYRLYNANVKGILPKHWKKGVLTVLILLLLTYGTLTYQRNFDWRNDKTLWEKTLEKNPNSARAYDTLGSFYTDQGNAEKALTYFQKAIQLNPKNYKTYTNLGVVYGHLGDYEKAEEALQYSIENLPNYYPAYDRLAIIYLRQKKYDEALKLLEAGTIIEPTYYKYYNTFGMILGQLGNFKDSIENFERSIELNHLYPDAYYNLGVVYEALNQKQKAKQAFAKALALEPTNANYREAYRRIS